MISSLVKIKHKKIKEDTIIHYPEVLDLCKRSYFNHPNGCPNIIKCLNDNNLSKYEIINRIGKYEHHYLIYAVFNFKDYKIMRKKQYPKWTDNQVKCVLYWQGSVKKLIREYIERVKKNNSSKFYVFGCGSGLKLSFQKQISSMESCCINVFSTMKLNGIKFEVKPVNRIVLCNLLLSKKELDMDFTKKVNKNEFF